MKNNARQMLNCRQATKMLDALRPEQLQQTPTAELQAHLAHCDACRTELGALRALRFEGTAWPLPPLDDVSRKRLFNQAIGAARKRRQEKKETSRPAGSRSAGSRLVWVASATALLGFLLALIASSVYRNSKSHSLPMAGLRAQTTVRLLLRDGPVLLEGNLAEVGTILGDGQRLRADSGRAVVGSYAGWSVLMEQGTEMTFRRLHPRNTELHLQRGQLLADVPPSPERQAFVVSTPHARVEVVGTLFSVRVSDATTTVTTYRGQVRVERKGRSGRLVSAGEQLGVKADSMRLQRATPNVRRRISLDRLRSILPRTNAYATLRVETNPAGVPVQLDGIAIGVTPCALLLEPGPRQLALTRTGRPITTTSLQLKAGQQLTSRFELGAAATTTTTTTAAATAATAGKAAIAASVTPTGRAKPNGRRLTQSGRRRSAAGSAASLLRRARRLRARRRFAAASRVYRRLLKRFPRRPEACIARVSLALLRLGPLADAHAALIGFDHYLTGCVAGGLTQEARIGRARALRKLGRLGEERQALRQLIERHPQAALAHGARRRLQVIKRLLLKAGKGEK